jgi:hypothetical protein
MATVRLPYRLRCLVAAGLSLLRFLVAQRGFEDGRGARPADGAGGSATVANGHAGARLDCGLPMDDDSHPARSRQRVAVDGDLTLCRVLCVQGVPPRRGSALVRRSGCRQCGQRAAGVAGMDVGLNPSFVCVQHLTRSNLPHRGLQGIQSRR